MSLLLQEITYHYFPVENAAVDNDSVKEKGSSGMEQLSSSEKMSGSRIEDVEIVMHTCKCILRKIECYHNAKFAVTAGPEVLLM